ncbi:MAG: DUF2811 domain-containing protein [Leptolyngbyaceae cyanobacterium RU_5_1]|nr:DUF2811 domain-containing protein [Leptolyngbyaceae cyanobacterium RU_5_1]
MNTHVSLLVEIPEILHESLGNYLEMRPDWDQDRVITAALSLFLLQTILKPLPKNYTIVKRPASI